MISSLYCRPVPSRKKINKIIKTQSNQIVKTYRDSRQGQTQRAPSVFHKDTAISHHQIVKYTPKNIIYDKETLYYEVKQLKVALNQLIDENHKLKTRIAIFQTQRDRLNKSVDKKQSEERYINRQSRQKKDLQLRKEIESSSQKLEVELIRKQNQKLKSELKKIKISAKYWQMHEKEIENKVYIDQNQKMSEKNQELERKIEDFNQILVDYQILKAKMSELSIQNKIFVSQIEDMHIEIMKLESEIKKYKYSPVKDQDFQRMILKSQPKRGQLTSERKIQTYDQKRKQRLVINSLKSHHLYAQPLKSLRKEQFRHTIVARHESAKNISSDFFREEIESDQLDNYDMRKKLQQTELRLRQLQKKIGNRKKMKPKSKETAVQTYQSSDEDQSKIFIKLSKKMNQAKSFHSFGDTAQPSQIQGQAGQIEVFHNEEVNRQAQLTVFQKQQKCSQTDLIFQNIQSSEPEAKQYKSQQNYQNIALGQKVQEASCKKTLPTQLNLKNTYQISDQLLMPIKKLLTYRFQHQKYTFEELTKDIEASEAKDFKYMDLCYMLVNEPFFLNIEYGRQVICFVFQTEKPRKNQSVTKGHLIRKLRKIIDDFQKLKSSEQTAFIQKCSNVITNYQKQLRQKFDSLKNGKNTIDLLNLTFILAGYSLKAPEIEFLISQVSIQSETIQTLNYQVLFERFLPTNSSQEVNREVILQNQDQENSYLGASNLGKHIQVPVEINKEQSKQVIFSPQEEESQVQPPLETFMTHQNLQNEVNRKNEILSKVQK